MLMYQIMHLALLLKLLMDQELLKYKNMYLRPQKSLDLEQL